MTEHGFKELTRENWLEPDPLSLAFSNVHDVAMGETRRMSPEEGLGYILEPQLSTSVPQDVRALFAVARGTMCYGYYFYPLYMLAAEQLFRVAEAAVHHRAEQLKAPKNLKKFATKLKFLVGSGAITVADKDRWDAIRTLRNEGASRWHRRSASTSVGFASSRRSWVAPSGPGFVSGHTCHWPCSPRA